MIDQEMLQSARSDFIKHAQKFWEILDTGRVKKANRESSAADAIGKCWDAKGALPDLLAPLLVHEDAAVRYAAAADLLNHGYLVEEAIAVLREIDKGPHGFISSSARLLLMKNKIAVE